VPGEHTYVGPRGKLVEPVSESEELEEINRVLRAAAAVLRSVKLTTAERHELREHIETVVRRLERLERQAAGGFHRNPPMQQMGSALDQIRYRHATDGKWYRHPFRSDDAELWATTMGGQRVLVIRGKRGKSMWDDF
jgi:hypothetical protein